MSNRNFDNRVIIQRLQNQNYARNLYKNNVNGGRLINNPQNTNGNSSEYTTYIPGVQTEYFRGLLDGAKTVSLGGTFGISPVPLPTATPTTTTVPDSPTSVSASAGDTDATVSFTAPVSDGGSAITGYTVTSDPDGITASGSSSPIIVTGLTNGTPYTFTVVATNSIGNSAPSDPSSAVTPNVIDQIIASLTTSLSAYNAAAADDWVQITAAEYTSLQTNISGTTKAGMSDAYMAAANGSGLTATDQSAIVCNTATTNTPAIGANRYLYGFSVKYGNNPTVASDARVYTNTNTSSVTGFNQVGSILPTLSTNIGGFAISYYVRKGVSSVNAGTAGLLSIFTGATTQSARYLGFYINFSVANTMKYLLFTPSTTGGIPNSSSVLSGSLSGYGAFAIQGLTTATKQWA